MSTDDQIARLMAYMDTNGDGVIDRAEFEKVPLTMFIFPLMSS